MEKRIAIPALFALFLIGCALFLLGCIQEPSAPAPEPAEAAATIAPAVVAIGAESNDAAAMPAATAPATPIPVGKVEYRPEDGAHYEILADKTVSVTGGYVEIAVDGMSFTSAVQVSDGGMVRLVLTNGASLTGALSGESMLDISVALDALSTWSLASDTRVDALVNGDASFQNVSSNGYALSYNCENAENAYLNRAALPLSGGGQLTPVI